ncbi:unnamed protein product [Rhodiola kirilowii]
MDSHNAEFLITPNKQQVIAFSMDKRSDEPGVA